MQVALSLTPVAQRLIDVTDEPPQPDPDLPLLVRFRAGERRAFDELVRRHQRDIWRVARRYVKNDADDVAQQTFVRAYRALDGFRGAASLRSWLYRIAINLSLNHVRDHARESPEEIGEGRLTTGPLGPQRLIEDEDAARLRAAIAQLPPKQRVVLELRVFDELSFREVAELDLDEATAAKLFPILNRYDDEFTKLAAEGVALRKQAADAEVAGDDPAIDQAIDDLVVNRRARWDLDEARFKEVRKVLSPAQAARILVVLPDIDRKILDGARKAVRAGKVGKGRKPAGKRADPADDFE